MIKGASKGEKVFISQPMAGKMHREIEDERFNVVKQLEKNGFTVIDSVIAKTPDEAFKAPVYYLSQAILKLSQADCAYFMESWEEARGCRIEHMICEEYGIPIIEIWEQAGARDRNE